MCLQIRDLLLESGKSLPKLCFGSPEYFIELMQEKVDNPLDFSRVLKAAFQGRGNNPLKINVSHLYGRCLYCAWLYCELALYLLFDVAW